MFSVQGNHVGNSSNAAGAPTRIFITPLARKLARERRLNLAHVRGSGPRGRIVASDVEPAPVPEPRRTESIRISAVGLQFDPGPIETMLGVLSKAELRIDFEDVAIRAVGAVLSLAHVSGDGPDPTVYLELTGFKLRFDGAATLSLSAIHRARSERPSSGQPEPTAALSIKFLDTGGVTSILLPPLSGFDMRLLIARTDTRGEANATLFFNEGQVAVELATSILGSLKQRLERPALLLL